MPTRSRRVWLWWCTLDKPRTHFDHNGDGGFGFEDVEVEDGFDAGEGFADGGSDHPAERKVRGRVGDGIDAVVATEEQGAKIVEPLGDDGEVAALEHVAGADHGVERAQAEVVEDERGLGDAACEQGALEFHRFVMRFVAAEDQALDFAGAIQGRGGVDATDEMLVDAALFDPLARGQDQAIAVDGQRTDVGEDFALGGGDDPDVAGENDRQQDDRAGQQDGGGDLPELAAAVAHGLVHWAGMLTVRRPFDKNSRVTPAKALPPNFLLRQIERRVVRCRANRLQKGLRVSKNVISFHYTLTDQTGKTLDSSAGGEPLTFLEEAGQIIPGLEAQIRGLKVGDKKHVTIKAKDAYGEHDAGNVMEVPLDKMPAKGIKAGDRFRAGKDSHAAVVTATKVTETHVTLDGNHPLAGMDLTFDVEITEVRGATEDELAHGHVHGSGGHHH